MSQDLHLDAFSHGTRATFHCTQAKAACFEHYSKLSDVEQGEKFNLRANACQQAEEYWSEKYGDTYNNCALGTLNLLGQLNAPWDGCDPSRRDLEKLFLNLVTFNTTKVKEALDTFIYQELSDTMDKIACALNAKYVAVKDHYFKQAIAARGVLDLGSLVRSLSQVAAHHIPVVGSAIPILAKEMLRYMWFGEPGQELVGMRYKVLKNPTPHPMYRCDAPRMDHHEIWEITEVTSFQDQTFSQYLPGAKYLVLKCVSGICTNQQGKPAPPILVNVKDSVEDVVRQALSVVVEAYGGTYEATVDAFEAFFERLERM